MDSAEALDMLDENPVDLPFGAMKSMLVPGEFAVFPATMKPVRRRLVLRGFTMHLPTVEVSQ